MLRRPHDRHRNGACLVRMGSARRVTRARGRCCGRGRRLQTGRNGECGENLLAGHGLDYKAHVWDAMTGEELQVLGGHTYDVKSARFSPEGERVVTASSDRTVRIWDVQTATQILQFAIGIDATDAFFTEDGNHILVTTAEGEILNYNVAWTSSLDKELKSRVCRNKLADLDKSHVCSRVGVLATVGQAVLNIGGFR
jgi:WD40 repeat protein